MHPSVDIWLIKAVAFVFIIMNQFDWKTELQVMNLKQLG